MSCYTCSNFEICVVACQVRNWFVSGNMLGRSMLSDSIHKDMLDTVARHCKKYDSVDFTKSRIKTVEVK